MRRDDLELIYDTKPMRIIHGFIELITAFNPWIKPPPQWAELVEDPEKLNRIAPVVLSESVKPAAFGIALPKIGDMDTRAAWALDNQYWLALAEAISLGAPVLTMRTRLRDWLGKVDSGRLADRLARPFPEPGLSSPTLVTNGGLSEPEQALVLLWLSLSWERILGGKYLEDIGEAPTGTRKNEWARVQRMLRLSALSLSLSYGLKSFIFRPIARLAAIPGVKARFLLEQGGEAETKLKMIAEAAAIPIHPWLAVADGVGAEAMHQSPWAPASRARGVPTPILNTFAQPGATLMDLLDAAAMNARAFMSEYQSMKAQPGNHLDTAAGVLGLTTSSTPTRVPLYAEEREYLHTDGVTWQSGGEITPTLLSILPILPAQLLTLPDEQEAWIGELRLVRAQSDLNEPSPTRARIYIEPEQPELIRDFVSRRVHPSAIAPGRDWQGDVNTIWLTSVDKILKTFSITADEMHDELAKPSSPWKKWIKEIGTDGKDLAPGSRTGRMVLTSEEPIYISSRTLKPWLQPVDISNAAAPTKIVAVSHDVVVGVEPTLSLYYRDLTIPPLSDDDRAAGLTQAIIGLLGR